MADTKDFEEEKDMEEERLCEELEDKLDIGPDCDSAEAEGGSLNKLKAYIDKLRPKGAGSDTNTATSSREVPDMGNGSSRLEKKMEETAASSSENEDGPEAASASSCRISAERLFNNIQIKGKPLHTTWTGVEIPLSSRAFQSYESWAAKMGGEQGLLRNLLTQKASDAGELGGLVSKLIEVWKQNEESERAERERAYEASKHRKENDKENSEDEVDVVKPFEEDIRRDLKCMQNMKDGEFQRKLADLGIRSSQELTFDLLVQDYEVSIKDTLQSDQKDKLITRLEANAKAQDQLQKVQGRDEQTKQKAAEQEIEVLQRERAKSSKAKKFAEQRERQRAEKEKKIKGTENPVAPEIPTQDMLHIKTKRMDREVPCEAMQNLSGKSRRKLKKGNISWEETMQQKTTIDNMNAFAAEIFADGGEGLKSLQEDAKKRGGKLDPELFSQLMKSQARQEVSLDKITEMFGEKEAQGET